MSAAAINGDAVAPDSNGNRVDRSGEPLIRAQGVWKIFGHNAHRVLGTADAE
jgi:hypothetical protein